MVFNLINGRGFYFLLCLQNWCKKRYLDAILYQDISVQEYTATTPPTDCDYCSQPLDQTNGGDACSSTSIHCQCH